jgi:GWxTD domain-containing protein
MDNELRVYQSTPSQIELHFEIDAGDLLYKKTIDDEFIARVEVEIESRVGFSQSALPDTASFEIVDKVNEISQRKIRGYSIIPFAVRDTSAYSITVRVRDLHRSQVDEHQLLLGTSKDDKRFVKLMNDRGHLSMHNVLTNDSSIVMESTKFSSYELEVKEYKDDFQMPLPPFSMDQLPSFSGKILGSKQVYREENGGYSLSCPSGMVCLYKDATSGETFSLRQTGEAFPEVTDIEKLIEVLKYISTKEEHEKMQFSENKKEAFEDFWLNCAGSRERARKLIAEFYQRVEESDRFFTAHVEGWRSDRGMIHIIYGPPNKITTDGTKETWYYGRSDDSSGLSMVFIKSQNNPFSGNDYRLRRELNYKASWYMAVDAWRGGQIVNF